MSIQPVDSRAPPQPGGAILVTVLIMAISLPSFASTVAIPSLPAIAQEFGTGFASVAIIQTFYMMGLAFPQLVYGGVSDRVGRRPTMMAGLGLFLAGSLICLTAPSVEILTLGRFAQAVGGCAGIALGRAILRDLFTREKAAAYLAYMTMATTAGPTLAPLIGGVFQEYLGWRAVFGMLIVLGLIALAMCWRALPETNKPGQEAPRWRNLAFAIVTLLRLPSYRNYAIPPACLTGSYQVFAATSTFVATTRLDVSPTEFGLGLSSIILTFSFGNFLSGTFGRRIGIDRLIQIGTCINLLFATLMLVAFLCDELNSFTFFGMMALMNIGQAFAISNALTSATGAVPGLVGSAAGLAGFLQMATAAAFATIVGTMIEDYIWILPASCVFMGIFAVIASFRAGRT
jgi:DHA1 family bicyclomycin/chloramphenicol resistance-like MFS transporter